MEFELYDNLITLNNRKHTLTMQQLEEIKTIGITKRRFLFVTSNVPSRISKTAWYAPVKKLPPESTKITHITYNPKTKLLMFYDKKPFFFRKPIYTKKIAGRYWGSNIPSKTKGVNGIVFYDKEAAALYFVMDWYTIPQNVYQI